MLCTVISGPSLALALKQVALGEPDSELFELRIDLLRDCNFTEISTLVDACSKPIVMTFREVVPSYFKELLELQPAYVDLDHHFSIDLFQKIRQTSPSTQTIRSWHSSESFPTCLEELYQGLKGEAIDLIKLCPTVQKTTEALELLCFQKKHPKKVISIAMGERGRPVRLLTVKFGSPFSYAAPSPEHRTAPGQLTAQEMNVCSSFSEISEETRLFGLIGTPLCKSIGDLAHNSAFDEFGYDAVYVKFELEEEELPLFFQQAEQLGIVGLSVTMPLKVAVLSYLTDLSPEAKKIGAVNTLYRKGSEWYGSNSDGAGASQALLQKTDLEGKKVALLGAGGAARAIAYRLKLVGAKVTVYNRTLSRAEKIADELGVEAAPLESLDDYEILVNCTPLSMPVAVEQLRSGTTVLETNIRPLESELVKAAEARGLKVVYGYEMFVEQAVLQWGIWFSDQFDYKLLRSFLYLVSQDHLLRKTAGML